MRLHFRSLWLECFLYLIEMSKDFWWKEFFIIKIGEFFKEDSAAACGINERNSHVLKISLSPVWPNGLSLLRCFPFTEHLLKERLHWLPVALISSLDAAAHKAASPQRGTEVRSGLGNMREKGLFPSPEVHLYWVMQKLSWKHSNISLLGLPRIIANLS